jgi:hypothetical protein
MALRFGTFTLDDLGLLFNAFGPTLCWLRGDNKLIVDRPDGSSWNWTREFGRWTEPVCGDILDGWV